MRVKIITILLLAGFAAIASVPKQEVEHRLKFGIDEFYTILLYDGSSNSSQLANEKFSAYFAHLRKKQLKYKTQDQFVEYAFYYIHKKLLKNYYEYASINQTLESGAYDCVTGTAIYSLFFTELEIPFSVIETNYHIYVLAFPDTKNEILIETTDPLGGFISDPQQIAARKQLYLSNNAEVMENQIDLAWDVETRLKGTDLMGVLLFNQSIKQYNLGHKKEAIELATKAISYYSSNRISNYLAFIKGHQFASN